MCILLHCFKLYLIFGEKKSLWQPFWNYIWNYMYPPLSNKYYQWLVTFPPTFPQIACTWGTKSVLLWKTKWHCPRFPVYHNKWKTKQLNTTWIISNALAILTASLIYLCFGYDFLIIFSDWRVKVWFSRKVYTSQNLI